MERQVRPSSKLPKRSIRKDHQGRRTPHRVFPQRGGDGHRGLRLGPLPAVGCGRADVRARRRHRPLQDLLGRRAADRVGRPGGPGRGGRLRLTTLARLGLRGRPRHRVRVEHDARRLRAVDLRGQPSVALRAQRGCRPGVAARGPGAPRSRQGRDGIGYQQYSRF